MSHSYIVSRVLPASLLATLAIACGAEGPLSHEENGAVEQHASSAPDAPEQKRGRGPLGEVILPDVEGNPRRWIYELIDGVAVAQGDIELGTLEELEQLQKGVVRTDRKWAKRTFVYTLHSSLTDTQEENILSALAHWKEKTQLNYRYKGSSDTDYVEFTYPSGYDGCASTEIGKKGGKQQIKLEPRSGNEGCTTGNIIHEIGHALGFEHEHTRSDRDDFIDYYEDRVIDGKEHNFAINDESYHADYYTIDFGSIMMYGSYAFAKDSSGDPCDSGDADCDPTLEKENGDTWEAQRDALSATDIKTFRKLYPKFEPPLVQAYRVYSNSASRNAFCKDNGYAASQSYTTETVSGLTIVASYDSTNAKWNFVVDTPPITDFTVVKTITCKF